MIKKSGILSKLFCTHLIWKESYWSPKIHSWDEKVWECQKCGKQKVMDFRWLPVNYNIDE